MRWYWRSVSRHFIPSQASKPSVSGHCMRWQAMRRKAVIAAEKAVDREAVGERDLPACARFCAIFQIDVGSGEIGRGLDQPHADQVALQLGRAIERAEGAEIAGARGWRGAPERHPGA